MATETVRINFDVNTGQVRSMVTTLTNASTKVDNLTNKLKNVGNGLKNIGSSMTNNVSKPIMQGFGAAIITTMDFDKTMSKVRATSGSTGKEFQMLRDKAKEMGESTSKTATESAQALEYMALAGWDTNQMMSGLEPILKASEAGAMDLGRASDLTTDSMSALGLEANQTGRYLDIAARAQNTSNQSMQQFLTAMVSAGGTFKMYNVPLEEAGALLGILANRGFKGAQAGNAMTSIMANLTAKSGKSSEAMGELGIKTHNTSGKFRGVTTILKDLNSKFDGMTNAQRTMYIQMIGGKTRTKEFNALLNGTQKELDGLTKKLYNSDGALSKMSKTMMNNLGGQFTKLKSALEGLLIQIGDRLTPYLRLAASVVQKLATVFLRLPTPLKDIAIVVALVVASIGPLLIIIGTLIAAVGAVVAAITAIAPIAATVGAVIAVVIGFFAYWAVIASVVSSAILYMVNSLIPLRDTLNLIKTVLSGNLTSAFDILVNKFGLSKSSARELTNSIKDIIDKARILWTVIKDNLGVAFKILKDSILSTLQGFGLFNRSTKETKGNAVSMFTSIISPIKNFLSYLYKTFDAFGLIPTKVKYAKDKTTLEFIELHANTKKAFDGMVAASGSMVEGISQKNKMFADSMGDNKESIKQNAESYKKMVDEVKTAMDNELKFMKNHIEKKKQASIKATTEFYKESSVFTEAQEQKKIQAVAKHYQDQQQKLTDNNNRIKEIMTLASTEKREFTKQELAEMKLLKDNSSNIEIQSMSNNALKQRAILEESKNLAMNISRQEALEVITLANTTYDKTLQAARKSKQDKIANIIMQRDQMGIISADEAQKLITEANGVYTKTVSTARQTKDQTVGLAIQKSNGTVAAGEAEKRQISNQSDKIKQVVKKLWTDLKAQLPSIVSGVVSAILKALAKGLVNGVKNIMSDAASALSNGVKNLVKIGSSAGSGGKKGKKNYTGNRYFEGGSTLVGEYGAELVSLPKGSQIYNNNQTRNIMNNNNNKSPTINISGGIDTDQKNQLAYALRSAGVY